MALITSLLSMGGIWPPLVASFAVYNIYLFIYRRYFHPLSHIPGPFLNSFSYLPYLYYQGILEGQLMHVLPKWHEKYGPIVRLTPSSLHLSNPAHYETLYTSSASTRFHKDPSFYGPMQGPLKTPIILTVISNEAHRARRVPLSPFFSRREVLGLEGIVRDKMGRVIHLMEEAFGTGTGTGNGKGNGKGEFDAHRAMRAVSVDIITEYAYGESWEQLGKGDWGQGYQDAIRAVQLLFPWFQTFPFLLPIFGMIPDWVNVKLVPAFGKWFESLETVKAAVARVRKEISLGVQPSRRTIFHELMDPAEGAEGSDEMDKKEKPALSDEIVFADAVNLTGAGAETTGATACRALFEVVSSPGVYKRLREELVEAIPVFEMDRISLVELEKLPYLTGVVKEALRLSPGLPGHLPRVVPAGGATFDGYAVPAGTVVSMSAWQMHHNPDLFPEPERFDPARWMGDDQDAVWARERCLVSFGRGQRNCIGQNLAMCELYYAVAAVIRRWDDLEVHPDFGREDLQLVELLLGYHPKNSRKLRFIRSQHV